MNRWLTASVLLATVLACTGSPLLGETARSDSARLMAAALTHLIGEEYGGGSSFSQYLIDTTSLADGVNAPRRLTDDERAAIEETMSQFGRVRWISNPEEWRTADLTPRIEHSVILAVGVPTTDDNGALVSVSTWCGGLCGMWLTYRIQLIDGKWQVTDIEGPIGTA